MLANLYLHYTFDKWMEKEFSRLEFVRYADDVIIHCKSEVQANYVLKQIQERFKECNLEVHPEKTSIVYCKDYRRKETGKKVKFDFLGFSFHPESKRSKNKGMYLGYDCTVSIKKYSEIVAIFKNMRLQRWTEATLQDIANELNPKIRGWMQYYEKFRPRSLKKVFRNLHNRLVKWVLNKHKRFKGSRKEGFRYLRKIRNQYSYLFYHWSIGYAFV